MSKEISTVNVVASSSIGSEIDLSELSDDMESTSYRPEKFPGLVYRPDSHDVSTLIFNSGKVVATGATGIEEAEDAVQSVFQDLRDLGISVDDADVVIQNVVNSTDIGSELNLNAIAIGLGVENVEYEPEQFPGLIYRIDDPEVCVLLFGSGETVVSGCDNQQDAREAVERVESELEKLDLI